MKYFLFFLSSLLLFDKAPAQLWKVNNDNSKVEFKIKNAGLTVEGQFSVFKAEVIFNPQDLLNSSIKGTIETNSISTGLSSRDNHLKGEAYFDVAKYPQMSFSSKKISSRGNGNYLVTGELKIKNKVKEVSIPFSFIESGNSAGIKGTFQLNRREYGVGGSSWILSDEVNIILSLSANKH